MILNLFSFYYSRSSCHTMKKVFRLLFHSIFSFYSFDFREQWKKLHWNFFHSILLWLRKFPKMILFHVFARKSMDYVGFRGPLFFHSIHYSRPASGRMKKCFLSIFFSFSIHSFSAAPSGMKK